MVGFAHHAEAVRDVRDPRNRPRSRFDLNLLQGLTDRAEQSDVSAAHRDAQVSGVDMGAPESFANFASELSVLWSFLRVFIALIGFGAVRDLRFVALAKATDRVRLRAPDPMLARSWIERQAAFVRLRFGAHGSDLCGEVSPCCCMSMMGSAWFSWRGAAEAAPCSRLALWRFSTRESAGDASSASSWSCMKSAAALSDISSLLQWIASSRTRFSDSVNDLKQVGCHFSTVSDFNRRCVSRWATVEFRAKGELLRCGSPSRHKLDSTATALRDLLAGGGLAPGVQHLGNDQPTAGVPHDSARATNANRPRRHR